MRAQCQANNHEVFAEPLMAAVDDGDDDGDVADDDGDDDGDGD